MFTYLSIFTITICVSYITIISFIKLFYKLDILDNPKKYKKKRNPVPYSIGVSIYIVFLLVSLLFTQIDYKYLLIVLFGGLITIISFIDDMVGMGPKGRLLIQILIGATIGLTTIQIGYISNIFGGIIDLETIFITLFGNQIFIIPVLFTIIWYVFIFNALNWTDGIPGNTSGLSAICFAIIFLLGLKLYLTDTYEGGLQNAEFIMILSLILATTMLVFFFFDVKEKLLMGDSGTMFLGFMLASLAIISGGKIATVMAVFGIYAVDAVYVIVRRIMRKKNPLEGDFTHLHHRLQNIGLSQKQILILIFTLSFAFGVTALFLDRTGKIIVFGVIIFFVVFLSYIGERVKKISFKK